MKNKLIRSTMAVLTAITLSLSPSFMLPVTAAASGLEDESEHYDGAITIEAPDFINNVDEFDVYGTASYKGGEVPENNHVFLEIVNQDPDKPYIYEIQMVAPAVNGEYRFSSILIPSGYADDTYSIRVYLWDDDKDELIGMNEKEVVLINQ